MNLSTHPLVLALAFSPFILLAEREYTDEQIAFWENEAFPVLEENCWSCHGVSKKIRGGLVLTTLEGVLAGGEFGSSVDLKKPADSLLLKMTSHQDKDHEMPPDGKMADEDVAVLARWIELGIPFPEADEVEPKGEVVHHGADYEKGKQHWGFKRAEKPALPDKALGPHPIDRFVNQRLEKVQLRVNGKAVDPVLIRRVYYDLTGLPPSPAEVEAYTRDQSKDKFNELVDRLLASPHYGEKWGRHWLDLVRYAETNGYERDGNKPEVWRYRDYVIEAFNQNKPYDRLILEHIAGDELPDADAASITATGYQRLGVWDDEPADRTLAKFDYLDDIVRTSGEVFLGMTIGCARCHDHKIDPISAKDYYSMLSFFANVTPHRQAQSNLINVVSKHQDLQALHIRKRWEARRNQLQKSVQSLKSEFFVKLEPKHLPVPLLNLPDARAGGLDWKYSLKNPGDAWETNGFRDGEWQVGKSGFGLKGTPGAIVNSEWKTKNIWLRHKFGLSELPKSLFLSFHHDEDITVFLNGRQVLHRTGYSTFYQTEDVTKSAISALQTGQNVLAVHVKQTIGGQFFDLALHGFSKPVNLDHLLNKHGAGVLNGGRFNLYKKDKSTLAKHLKTEPSASRYPVLAVAESGNHPIHVLRRGNPSLPGRLVSPAFPSILDDTPAEIPPSYKTSKSSGRRRVLAEWLASADNPMTARVMVNRIWQYHFGRGIVRSPNDFGLQGNDPTHPDLLTWLAHQFVESGWDIKAMHRLIMSSDAYQRSSAPQDQALVKDPLNDLFWRFNMRRLQAEEVRDSILAARGSLNLQMGGPSVTPPLPAIVLATASQPNKAWGRSTPAQASRRSVYVKVKRSLQDPILLSHDAADTDATCPVRFTTTVPTQALTMINGAFVNDSALTFAERIRRQGGDTLRDQVRNGLSIVFSRPPKPEEVEAGVRMVEEVKVAGNLTDKDALDRFALLALNLNEFIYLD
ncbi:MAG: PSD1 and planctomycete cytochrome C domain-containing protein [Opitutales bacterium]|nr:PSD1 and planctomycete cytochrome C domain-containing protein [Opitutales bacterium]